MHLDVFSSVFERLSSHSRGLRQELERNLLLSVGLRASLLLLRAFKARICRCVLNHFFGGDPSASSLAFNIKEPPLELVNG